MSCQIKMNTMNLMLGVSGSGKSTLLKAFTSKTGTLPSNFHGQLFLPKRHFENLETSKLKRIYLAYVSQKDAFHESKWFLVSKLALSKFETQQDHLTTIVSFFPEVFTIREQLEMVFELKYANNDTRDRVLDSVMLDDGDRKNVDKNAIKRKLVDSLIDEMNLRESANTKIRFCSGGEKKRLSIALELIALPDILLLDEPTTGLDSFTSMQVIGLLERFIQSRNMTVLAVLHQPSFALFNKFGNVIVQDKNGRNIFNGPPHKLVPYLANFELACPANYNPADFVLDVANGDFDDLQIREKLVDYQRERHELIFQKEVSKFYSKKREINQTDETKLDVNEAFVPLPKVVLRNCSFYWTHLWVLTKEAYKMQLTDTVLLYLKAVFYSMNLAAFHVGFGMTSGKYDGCPNQNLTREFEPSRLAEVLKFNKENSDAVMATSGNLYLTVYTACYSVAALPAIMIPNELKIFIKQLNNQWYSFGSYYMSRVLADVPIITGFLLAYGTLNILLTGVSVTFERYIYLMNTYVILGIFIHSTAFLIGAIFIDSANASIYIITVGSIPLAMISERTKLATETSNLIINALMQVSFVKYSFRAMAVALYGNRCDYSHQATFINYTTDMKDWLNERLRVKTAEDDVNFQGSGATEGFTNNLVRLINGEYFNKKNKENPYELRSMILNKVEFDDFHLVDQWLALIYLLVVARILSVLLASFLIRRRIF